jgi:hypothetical protein
MASLPPTYINFSNGYLVPTIEEWRRPVNMKYESRSINLRGHINETEEEELVKIYASKFQEKFSSTKESENEEKDPNQ